MRIAFDIMSGDNPPEVLINGALLFISKFKENVILIGDRNLIHKKLALHPAERTYIDIVHTDEVIEMDEEPLSTYKKKKNASVTVAARLVSEGDADGFFSPGNTGATLTSALFEIGKIKGVKRPAIATFVPNIKGFSIIIDAGANTTVKPNYLFQFAVMGYIFYNKVIGKEKPTIGILSNGEEKTKGTDLTKTVYQMLEKSGLNFIGYIEGYDLFTGDVDIIVSDGFTGNIALKVTEGTGDFVFKLLKQAFKKNIFTKLSALVLKRELKKILMRVDPREYGGAPLLGIDGEVIIGHGNSDEIASYNGLRMVKKMIELDIKNEIEKAIKSIKHHHIEL